MSSDTAAGRSSRRILVIAASILMAAMMLAVPVFAAVDTDADLVNDEVGYCVTIDNPTDAQLASIGVGNRSNAIISPIEGPMEIFNTGIFAAPAADAESLKVLMSEAQKITSDSDTSYIVSETSAEKAVITIDANFDGALIDPDIDDPSFTDEQRAAANAIKDYLGNEVSAGDRVTITGTLKQRMAISLEVPYKMLDDGKCISSGYIMTAYAVQDIDVTITLKHAGTEKSISLYSNVKGMGADEDRYEFQGDIQVGSKYTVKNILSDSHTGDEYFTVDGKDYNLDHDTSPTPDYERTVTAGDIVPQSSVVIEQSLKDKIAALPSSSDNMTVDKTYSAAESAFDDVVEDAIGDSLMKLLLIIGGAILGFIVLIVVVVIVVVVIVRKKKA